MSNLGCLFQVFLLSSFLAAASTDAPDATNATNLQGIECDSCQFVTHKIDDYIFHNEKVMGFVKDEFDNICNLLPDDAKNICFSTVNQTLPSILASIGDFIATNGCQEIGICHPP
jgi:hypothetical protein